MWRQVPAGFHARSTSAASIVFHAICNEKVLDGDVTFVKELSALGFGRVQVNATKANNVDMNPARYTEYAQNLRACMAAAPDVEWIMQRNEETTPLCELLQDSPPSNMSFLFDASCGQGVFSSSFPAPIEGIPCGYAGGIGPKNIGVVLNAMVEVGRARPVWIDMESSLREHVTDKDVSPRNATLKLYLISVLKFHAKI
jgi:hypothetical protein